MNTEKAESEPAANVAAYPRPNLVPAKRGVLTGALDVWVAFIGLAWLLSYKLALSFVTLSSKESSYAKNDAFVLIATLLILGVFFLAQIAALAGIGFGKRWAFWCWLLLGGVAICLLLFIALDMAKHGRRFRLTPISDLSYALDTAIAIYCILRLGEMRKRSKAPLST